jgi:hypothetical protein
MEDPKIPWELDKTAPQLKGTVITSTGEKVSGNLLIKIKDKDGWYEFFETQSFRPAPWLPNSNIPTIVKIGSEWYFYNLGAFGPIFGSFVD